MDLSLVIIKSAFPVTEREYTDRNGNKGIFRTKGFILSDGIDECYAEMWGDAARDCPEYDTTVWHRLKAHTICRAYTDRNGQTRYSNEIIIDKLV